MVALAMVRLDKVVRRASEVPLAERDDPNPGTPL